MNQPSGPTLRLLLLALALLGGGWLLAPSSAPPLYDGVGFPDEPYRFVHTPEGASATKPPTFAVATASVAAGRCAQLNAASAESAPQVTVNIPAGELRVRAGTTSVKLTAAPEGMLPAAAGQYLWSNVYDVTVTPDLTLQAAQQHPTITMRAATGQRPTPHIAVQVGHSWTLLSTLAVGNDIYQAQLPRFGRFAVIGAVTLDVSQIKLGGGEPVAGNTGILIALGAVAALIVLFVLGERRRSTQRKRRPAQQGGR
ncbi:MAG: hypothetical protein ACR2LF_05580 [Jatrophihabitantaceae bacterium]